MTKCAQCGKDFESPTGKIGGRCPDCLRAEEQFHEWRIHLFQTKRLVAAPVLIALNVGIFALMVAKGVSPFTPSGADLLPWGADYGPTTLGGEWWRLLTSNFLHFGILHLALNMWCLWDLSQFAERVVGTWRFLVVYLITGVAGSVVNTWWEPRGVAAGASGAVFGVAGLLVAILFFGRIRNVPKVGFSGISSSLLIFVAYNLAIGAVRTGISNSAHIGGLVTGLMFGLLLPVDHPAAEGDAPAPSRAWDRRTLVVTAGVAVLVVAGFADARRKHAPLVRLEHAEFLLDSGRSAEALAEARSIAAQNPEFPDVYSVLGRAALSEKQPAEAVAALRKAVDFKPEDGYLNAMLGYALIRLSRHAEAVEPLRKAVAITPAEPNTRFNLALAYLESGNHDSAIEEFKKVLQHLPAGENAHRANATASIGDAYLRKGDGQGAVEYLERAALLMPGPEAYSVLSLLEMAYRMTDKPKKADEIRARMKTLEPQSGEGVSPRK